MYLNIFKIMKDVLVTTCIKFMILEKYSRRLQSLYGEKIFLSAFITNLFAFFRWYYKLFFIFPEANELFFLKHEINDLHKFPNFK